MTKGAALVFGASGEQGRAVIEGLAEAGYSPVYGFTRLTEDDTPSTNTYLTDALGCRLFQGDIANPEDVARALLVTKAQAIFLTTTTELPTEPGQTTGCWNAMEAEYEVIQVFFDELVKVHQQDGLERHVIFSTKDNVQQLWRDSTAKDPINNIVPMDDGSIVPHYSAKGKGGEYALKLLQDVPGLTLTLVILPFVYSNFLGFFTPLPVETDGHVNQWQISASLGDGSVPLDMMAVSDLSTIVPNLLEDPKRYPTTIRLSGGRISMDQIALEFTSLFGKDIVYNPLLPEEVAALPFPSAAAMAQMGVYLQQSARHDTEITQIIMAPKHPMTFESWLLTHSDSTAFARVHLDVDAPEITSVVVFDAASHVREATSVIKGLLNDTRKTYTVKATVDDIHGTVAQTLQALDPDRVTLCHANLDDAASCQEAARGMGGAFLLTDFYTNTHQSKTELRHAQNIIDACAAVDSVQHIVFSTMGNVEDLNLNEQFQGPTMDAKAKVAAYARSKKLSVTYVILPCYSERLLDMIKKQPDSPTAVNDTSPTSASANKREKLVLTVPLPDKDAKVICMSIDDLGPAVSSIFDSFQVYAGHEVGLVSDFVTVSEICEALNSVLPKDGAKLEPATVTQEEWVSITNDNDNGYMKDLGQIFAYLSHTDVVKKRHSLARTMKLVPSARPLKLWIEQNKDNPAFREKLGLR